MSKSSLLTTVESVSSSGLNPSPNSNSIDDETNKNLHPDNVSTYSSSSQQPEVVGSDSNTTTTTNLKSSSSNFLKHPLSHLYANFINNNPKLNTFNYQMSDSAASSSSSIDVIEQSSSSTSSLSQTYQRLQFSSNVRNSYSANLLSATVPTQTTSTTTSSQQSSQQPNLLQLNRSKMIYHCKFGEFGINDGQFTEPSGVTINTNNDIIVADTNSHRIQIFDKDGAFRFKFGECGKRDGQLLYPNRVAVVKQTGDIVVTERSPTHQIQIYNKNGEFVRKFGANILQHPRGVYVDYKARIVVVECKVMRVIIFDLNGNVLNKFNCSKYLEFPNGVCCSNPTNPGSNQREEIYISDNRAHCIKVFDYNGNYLRQIGSEGKFYPYF